MQPLDELVQSLRGRNVQLETDKWLSHQSNKSIKKLVKRVKKITNLYHLHRSTVVKVEDRDHQNKSLLHVRDGVGSRYKISIHQLLSTYWVVDERMEPILLLDLIAFHRGTFSKNQPKKLATGHKKNFVRSEPKPVLFIFHGAEH